MVTGGRSDYGPLYWVLREIQNDPEVELLLFVTGMHLSREFGLTVRDIEQDGFPVTERVEMLLSSDSREAAAIAMGIGMMGFARAFSVHRPDLLVVLGDRFEILAAVAAALPLRIPVAHIHGGESTEGAIDDAIRHAVTKMSHLHFAATSEYAARIVQMGELPDRVFSVGAPSLDHVHRTQLPSRAELLEAIGVQEDGSLGILTYHPATLEAAALEAEVHDLLAALAEHADITWVVTIPNADPGGRAIADELSRTGPRYLPRLVIHPALGSARYFALLREAVVMVGNSSSGLIEAPAFGLPVVNIGTRQRGRVRASNVIDVPLIRSSDISRAIAQALGETFRRAIRGAENPYGEGGASRRIVAILRQTPLGDYLLWKPFCVSPGGA